tara:strand:+ start:7121 stop:8017 length:897 start_codon:yes stop_codon:yes gene_type:complete
MSKFKMYFLSLISLFILVSCSSCSHIPINEDQYKLGELVDIDSIVKVESVYIIEHCVGDVCNTHKMMSTSTGAAVANSVGGKYILTTGHTCNPEFGVPRGLTNVKVTQHTFVVDSSGDRHATITVDFDRAQDVCILHSKSLTIPNLPVGWKSEPDVGDKVYNFAASVGVFGEKTIPVLEGRYSGKYWGMSLYTIPAIGGSSGSPIFNVQGKLVGMIHSVHSRFHHLSFGPYHQKLMNFIKLNTPHNVPRGIRTEWTDMPEKRSKKIYLDEVALKRYLDKVQKECECLGRECIEKCTFK